MEDLPAAASRAPGGRGFSDAGPTLARQATGTGSSYSGRLPTLLLRYPAHLRPALLRFATASSAQRDLLNSFPALAVAVTSGVRSARRCAQARALLNTDGVPLQAVATALAVPMWLKRLSPEALNCQLPARIGHGGGDTDFGARIANVLPDRFSTDDAWLSTILEARCWAGDEVAMWLAKAIRTRKPQSLPAVALQVLSAWTFFSRRPETLGARHIASPWSAGMSLATAGCQAWEWLLGLLSELRASGRAEQACWSLTVTTGRLEFAPLQTLSELRAEGQAMHNCVARYAERVIRGFSRIYSVHVRDVRLATLEISPGDENVPAQIRQLECPGNRPPADWLRRAAEDWVDLVSGAPSLNIRADNELTVGLPLWNEIFEPYWIEHDASCLFGPTPPTSIVRRLLDSMRCFVESISRDGENFSDRFFGDAW